MCLFCFLLYPQHLDHLPGAERAHRTHILSELIILLAAVGSPQEAKDKVPKRV